jgi:hypothetical protein
MAENGFPRTLTQAIRVVIGMCAFSSILEGFEALYHGRIRIALWFVMGGAVVGILDIYIPGISRWLRGRKATQNVEDSERVHFKQPQGPIGVLMEGDHNSASNNTTVFLGSQTNEDPPRDDK